MFSKEYIMSRKCSTCSIVKEDVEFKRSDKKSGNQCRSCKNARLLRRKNERRESNPLLFSITEKIQSAKRRAKRDGYPFAISVSDIKINEFCPILGIKIDYTQQNAKAPNSASLDKKVPELGYVPGNVEIISYRANYIKGNATKDELRKILDYIT